MAWDFRSLRATKIKITFLLGCYDDEFGRYIHRRFVKPMKKEAKTSSETLITINLHRVISYKRVGLSYYTKILLMALYQYNDKVWI